MFPGMSVAPSQKVVIVGGGIAGMACAKALDGSCEVTVVERSSHYHIPMPSTRAVVDETFAWQQFVPLEKSLKKGKVLNSAATGLLLDDAASPKVLLADGSCLDADAVVLAIGARYSFPAEDDFGAKVTERYKAFKAESARLDENKSVLVVGGGPVGCERASRVFCCRPFRPSFCRSRPPGGGSLQRRRTQARVRVAHVRRTRRDARAQRARGVLVRQRRSRGSLEARRGRAG